MRRDEEACIGGGNSPKSPVPIYLFSPRPPRTWLTVRRLDFEVGPYLHVDGPLFLTHAHSILHSYSMAVVDANMIETLSHLPGRVSFYEALLRKTFSCKVDKNYWI